MYEWINELAMAEFDRPTDGLTDQAAAQWNDVETFILINNMILHFTLLNYE